RADETDVLATGELLMQAAGNLDHGEYPAVYVDAPTGRWCHTGQDLQQGALGGTIAPDDGDGLTASHLEVDVLQHPRPRISARRSAGAGRAPRAVTCQPARQRQPVPLPHAFHVHGDVIRHDQSTSAKYCEVKRNSGQDTTHTAAMPTAEYPRSCTSGVPFCTRTVRKPSMIPTIGLSSYQPCHPGGTLCNEYMTGVANIHSCINNGSAKTVSSWYVPSAATTKPTPTASSIVSRRSSGHHSNDQPTGVR